MHKINLKDFRFLHDFTDENIILLLSAGDRFIDVDRDTFRDSEGGYYKLDRKTIRETWKQQRGLDTHKWTYWTNDAGSLLINK